MTMNHVTKQASRFANLMLYHRGSKKRMQKKMREPCFPFLGEYLKDLKVMDTRMEDDLEELFKKVLPHQCLGSVWSQRRKPGKEHVASTVSATVRQFNHVATCVITTCLGDPSMMAQDRAKVVEHWIKVAKSSNKDSVEQLADRFTFALNGYKGQVRQDRKTVQCQTETSKEDIIEVVAHGPDYTTYQVRVQVNQADDTIQCLSESSNRHITEGLVNGFNYSTSLDPGKVHQATDTIQGQTQCAAERTGNLHESCRMHALQEGTSEKVAMAMVPAFLGGIIPHVSTLACSRAQRFLDELLTRAFAAMVGTWLDQVQGLGQPLPFAWFEVEQALVPVNSPASHLVGHAQNLWVELEHLKPTEATQEGPRPELQRSPEPEEGPAQGPEPGLTGAWPGLRQYLKPLWSQLLSALEAFSFFVLRVLGNYLK
ncbi:ral guanine nucleotide dissociation stimulator-like [Myotis myotis]|uniref:ral guanine nucleotide dissociation stimulator-like n=1 Tax=Myotis myotis TaxID=51298 RepID=UPI001748924B|nr:ral guanine nucleotide dissociation stimulator-like [Myotis myotis]